MLSDKDIVDILRIVNAVTMQGSQAERIVELKQKLHDLRQKPGLRNAVVAEVDGTPYNNGE